MTNHDELRRRMEQDELEDSIQHRTKMTPREYAKARGVTPQLVYYYIRTGKLIPDWCECGRKVVVIEEADEVFRFTNKELQDE